MGALARGLRCHVIKKSLKYLEVLLLRSRVEEFRMFPATLVRTVVIFNACTTISDQLVELARSHRFTRV